MSDTVIKVEGIGKRYRILHARPERYAALRDVIEETVLNVFRPTRPISADHFDLTASHASHKSCMKSSSKQAEPSAMTGAIFGVIASYCAFLLGEMWWSATHRL